MNTGAFEYTDEGFPVSDPQYFMSFKRPIHNFSEIKGKKVNQNRMLNFL